MEEEECYTLGGYLWVGGHVPCDPNPCLDYAVCCLENWDCILVTSQEECDLQGGTYHPEWTTCEPNPCVPTPTDNSSWGRIKSMYR